MPKITRWNTWYMSPFEHIRANLLQNMTTPGLYGYFWPEDYELLSKHRTLLEAGHEQEWDAREAWNFFLQSFHPLESMGRDFANTFLPYKSKHHIAKDTAQILLQPVKGCLNILRGIAMIPAVVLVLFIGLVIVTPLVLIVKIIRLATPNIEASFSMPASMGVLAFSWLMDGITSILRGITQIIFTPLIPLRLLSRAIATKIHGWQKFENDRGVKKLASLIHKKRYRHALNKISLHSIFIRKLAKAKKQGRNVAGINHHSFLYPKPEDIIPANLKNHFLQKRFDDMPQVDREVFISALVHKLKTRDEAERNRKIIKLINHYDLLNITFVLPPELRLLFNNEKYQQRSDAETSAFRQHIINTLTIEDSEARKASVLAILKENGLYTPNYAKIVMMLGQKTNEQESSLPIARLPRPIQANIANYCEGRVIVKPRAEIDPVIVLPENLRPLLDITKFNRLNRGNKIEIATELRRIVNTEQTVQVQKRRVIHFLREKDLYSDRTHLVKLATVSPDSPFFSGGQRGMDKNVARRIAFFTQCEPLNPPQGFLVVTPALPEPASQPATQVTQATTKKTTLKEITQEIINRLNEFLDKKGFRVNGWGINLMRDALQEPTPENIAIVQNNIEYYANCPHAELAALFKAGLNILNISLPLTLDERKAALINKLTAYLSANPNPPAWVEPAIQQLIDTLKDTTPAKIMIVRHLAIQHGHACDDPKLRELCQEGFDIVNESEDQQLTAAIEMRGPGANRLG